MVKMGIDPSIQSTGICINEDGTNKYFLIASKPTKKLLATKHERLSVIPYAYRAQTNMNSWQREDAKARNVQHIAEEIRKLICQYQPEVIVMEAVAFQASGTIDMLAGLNYAIRLVAFEYNIPIYVLPPTTIKSKAVGNGQATKDMMIHMWNLLDPEMKDIQAKVDDLADAYFMCNLNQEDYENI